MAQPQAIEKVHEALGVRLFTPPPVHINPLTASDRELLVYGFPPRPDAKVHPDLLRRWEDILSRPMKRIEPQFNLRTDRGHGPRLHEVPVAAGDTYWSGSIAYPAYGTSVYWVQGEWTVPAVVAPGSDDYYSATWIGIDGIDGVDVLQAGSEQDIVGGRHSTYVWWEWWPEPEVQIANFAVSPGDIMHCLICAESSTEAYFYLYDVTTGRYTSFTKTAPTGISLTGNSLEWIVERPQVGNTQPPLAQYGEVFFDLCQGGTAYANLYAGRGHPLTMVDSNNNPISVPTFETDKLIKLRYVSA